MNKNAAIIEGDTTKKFNPVSKVKVSNSDTGESTWIPEDSIETHSLSVMKNGIYYAASEGYTAYDSVTVNVSSETEVNYEGILMDMPDLADLGLYDLDDLEGLEGLDLENMILDGDLEEGEIPTSNTKIKGVDPDSGETLEVGVDEDGYLDEKVLPDHIKIVVLPAKRHYQEGELIDFSYMHVYLMKRGTERFTCEQYPTGEIPFEELMFPVTVAEESGESKSSATSDLETTLQQPISFSDGNMSYTGVDGLEGTITSHNGAHLVLVQQPDGAITMFATSKNNDANIVSNYHWTYDGREWSESRTSNCNSSYTHNNKTVFYSNNVKNSSVSRYRNPELVPDAIVESDYYGDGESAWTIEYGSISEGSNDIPVQWIRSDGEILEDTFTITIGEGEDPEPEPDPYAGQCDFTWEGKKYCFNKSLARSEVMYSNGTVWQTWLGGQSPPYTVEQALKLKLIVHVGNTSSGRGW